MVGPEWAGLVSLPAVVCGRSIATPADCRMGRRVLRRLSAFVLFRGPDACGRHRADCRRPVAMMIHVIDRDPGGLCLPARPPRPGHRRQASHAGAVSNSSLSRPIRIRSIRARNEIPIHREPELRSNPGLFGQPRRKHGFMNGESVMYADVNVVRRTNRVPRVHPPRSRP